MKKSIIMLGSAKYNNHRDVLLNAMSWCVVSNTPIFLKDTPIDGFGLFEISWSDGLRLPTCRSEALEQIDLCETVCLRGLEWSKEKVNLLNMRSR